MLIDEKLVVMDLEASTKKEAIEKLAQAAAESGRVNCTQDYVQAVIEREEAVTTGVGNGIAIPHGKSRAVNEPVIIFGRLKRKIDWDALDNEPVDMIFMLGIPEENVDNVHLKILSQLSRKLMNEEFVSKLRLASSSECIVKELSSINAN